MSIIFKDNNGKIKMYIKGADIEIIRRLSKTSKNSKIFKKLKEEVDIFSNLGYRTLMIAYRELKEQDFIKWKKKLYLEEINVGKKYKLIERYYDIIEQNFELLGATVVEDKLQDKVPETIKDIKSAGIKFWVLTGDKMSTAENIGLSCNLLTKEHQIFKIYNLEHNNYSDIYDDFHDIYNFFGKFQKYLQSISGKNKVTIFNPKKISMKTEILPVIIHQMHQIKNQ